MIKFLENFVSLSGSFFLIHAIFHLSEKNCKSQSKEEILTALSIGLLTAISCHFLQKRKERIKKNS